MIVLRLSASVFVIFGSLLLVFVIMYALPGDVVDSLVDPASSPPEVVANLRHQLGLDRSFHEQLQSYIGRMITGDFGVSLKNAAPVLPLIWSNLPATLLLATIGSLISTIVGITLGVLSAVYRERLIDIAARVVGLFGISMPTFWSGILLIILFSHTLGWFPSMGSEGWRSLVLPSAALGIAGAGFIVRLVRNSMLEVLEEPYIATLRAKGLPERLVLYRHALRNAIIPAVTMIGLMSGEMLGGSVVIETVFARQGIGRVLSDALMAKDLPIVQGVVFFSAVVYTLVNLIVDLSYLAIDPRARRSL